ncbi:MAG: hypothetical protein K6A72_09420 [Lachnospiraceae bacterium]|nr:hypothetical protein [Lachnospiraceae bacterium]
MGLEDSVRTTLGFVQKAKITVLYGAHDKQAVEEKPATSGTGGISGGLGNMLGKSNNIKRMPFTVQFNPNTLKFSGMGGDLVNKMSFGGEVDPTKDGKEPQRTIAYETVDPRITMRVQLIFDEVTWADMDYGVAPKAQALVAATAASAATSGSFGVSAGQIAAVTAMDAFELGAKKAIRANTGAHKVRERTEAFLAICRRDATNTIEFAWGHMLYRGVVSNVSAEYSMFTSGGEPLRSRVDFEMVLLDDEVKATSMGRWEKAYELLFEDSSSASGIMQSIGESLFSM